MKSEIKFRWKGGLLRHGDTLSLITGAPPFEFVLPGIRKRTAGSIRVRIEPRMIDTMDNLVTAINRSGGVTATRHRYTVEIERVRS